MKNLIILLFVTIALASCSVEKRVYQPGYHIEWNHYAEQDVSRDITQDASRDVTQDASRDVAQDATQDATRDLSENLETDASQDVAQDVAQDAERYASRDLSENLSKNLETDVSPDVSQDLSKQLETDVSQGTGKSIDSDLEMILLIILALFLPALTIFLLEGFSKNFWIALLLMVLAFSLPVPLFLQLLIEGLATVLAIAVVLHYL